MSVATPPPPPSRQTNTRFVVLAGNPNCGKTTLFNTLTGLRAKVGNYPGVTVERKEGRLTGSPKDQPVRLLDLPGSYSLSPQSLDEQVTRDVLFHRLPNVPPPSLVLVILDASNLQRNLYFATQIIELGYPTIIALNMIDVANNNGLQINAPQLAQALGAPVFPIVANQGTGIEPLRQAILNPPHPSRDPCPPQFCTFPKPFLTQADQLASSLARVFPEARFQAVAEAALLLTDDRFLLSSQSHYPPHFPADISSARTQLEKAGLDWRSLPIEARYIAIAKIQEHVSTHSSTPAETFSDKLDGIVTHRFWGPIIFVAIMTLIFQSIFTFAEKPMEWLELSIEWFGASIGTLLPTGPLHSLIVDGVIAGVGAVLVFLPQICLLFLFIGLLEDTGYMARAAFLMDRLMSRVGLHGKSFIPMLSSFACAIPGIMATRTIESPKDRLATILVAPLMSCSARLPVYTVLIAACIPPKTILGIFGLQGITLLSMYLLGTIVALLMAWLFKRTLLKGPTPMLIMELPPYKRPLLRTVLHHMWDRSKMFIRRAGTVILGIMILLWFLASYPKNQTIETQFAAQRATLAAAPLPTEPVELAQAQALRAEELAALSKLESGERLRHSFAGQLGRLLEPLIAPLGFDWKIGIGIVGSFAAREVFISTMSLVYNVGELNDSEQATVTLAETLQAQRRPDGTPVYTTLVAISLMVFYVFALQCVSTIAIVKRETNSWRWPLFQWLYMSLLAWTLSFLTYQGGRLLGWG